MNLYGYFLGGRLTLDGLLAVSRAFHESGAVDFWVPAPGSRGECVFIDMGDDIEDAVSRLRQGANHGLSILAYKDGDDGYHDRRGRVKNGVDLGDEVVESVWGLDEEGRAANVFFSEGGTPLVVSSRDGDLPLAVAKRRLSRAIESGDTDAVENLAGSVAVAERAMAFLRQEFPVLEVADPVVLGLLARSEAAQAGLDFSEGEFAAPEAAFPHLIWEDLSFQERLDLAYGRLAA